MSTSSWVSRFVSGIAAGGQVLDVACGGGRHLRAALAAGHRVVGVDINLAGVADLAGRPDVELIEADLQAGAPPPFAGQKFDGVIVTNYLWRPILPDIVKAVAPAGLLIYETFAIGNAGFGKPSNPDYLLKPGELLDFIRPSLMPICFETVTVDAAKPKAVQRIAAVGPEHPWLSLPPQL